MSEASGSLGADAIVDRRRLKRRLSLWRFGAVGALLLAFFVFVAGEGLLPGEDHIARVSIAGIIVDDQAQQELLSEIAEDDSAKALILWIDSPGGTTTGSEALYEAVRNVAAEKPVVAVLGTVAASGGYIAAISADHIVARGNSITGSIGVLFQWAQFTGLMEKLGIDMRDVKSSPLKAEPNPFTEPSAAALKATKDMVTASYDWFIALVADRRGLDEAAARKLGDGRVYTGWQAVKNGLIDEIGGEDVALAWLTSEHDIDAGLPVTDWEVTVDPLENAGFAGRVLYGLGQSLGVGLTDGVTTGLAEGLAGKTLQTKRLTLDGLTSVWHPERQQ